MLFCPDKVMSWAVQDEGSKLIRAHLITFHPFLSLYSNISWWWAATFNLSSNHFKSWGHWWRGELFTKALKLHKLYCSNETVSLHLYTLQTMILFKTSLNLVIFTTFNPQCPVCTPVLRYFGTFDLPAFSLSFVRGSYEDAAHSGSFSGFCHL